MKSNKLSNFDTVKNFKYFIIAPLAILLVGIILFFAVGFNKSIEFTGGTYVNVYIGETLNQQDDVKDKIDDILSENGLKASIYQITENNLGFFWNVSYQDIKGKTKEEMTVLNQKVVSDLYEAFNYNSQDSFEKNYIQGNQSIDGTFGKSLIVNLFTAVVVGSLAIMLYMFIRYGITSGMSSLLCVFVDLLITLSLSLIFRLPVSTAFIISILSVMCISFANCILFFNKIREKNKLEKITDNKTVANQTVKENFKKLIIVNSSIIVAMIIFVIFGLIAAKELFVFALPVILGTISSFYTSNFIAPTLWSFAYVQKNKIKKEKIDKVSI